MRHHLNGTSATTTLSNSITVGAGGVQPLNGWMDGEQKPAFFLVKVIRTDGLKFVHVCVCLEAKKFGLKSAAFDAKLKRSELFEKCKTFQSALHMTWTEESTQKEAEGEEFLKAAFNFHSFLPPGVLVASPSSSQSKNYRLLLGAALKIRFHLQHSA